MSKREDWPNDKVVTVFENKAANMTAAATAIGIARRTLVRWREADPELDAKMKDIEESLVDYSESQLMAAIQEGNLTAIIFHLKTKGKNRGYIEGQEISATVRSAKPMTQQEAKDFIQNLEDKY